MIFNHSNLDFIYYKYIKVSSWKHIYFQSHEVRKSIGFRTKHLDLGPTLSHTGLSGI